MKIAHVLLSLEVGGLENGLVNLVNGSHGFDHLVCCLKQAGPLRDRLRPGVRVVEMGWAQGKSLTLPLRLAALFRRERCAIVRCMNVTPLLYGFLGARLARVPALIYSNGGRVLPESPRRLRLERYMANRADCVIPVSAKLADYLRTQVGVRLDRIVVLENGVDLSRFAGPFPYARERLGLSPENFVVGSIGRLAAPKDFETLLRAFHANASRIPSGVLLIAGDGPERSALEQVARELGLAARVRFLGARQDIPEILAALDVFVLSSRSEGFSNVILEAMASGLPVVATDVGDNARLVVPDETGILVPPGDRPQTADALLGLYRDHALRRRLGADARRRASETFSLARMVGRYEALFSEVLQLGPHLPARIAPSLQ